MNETFSVKGGDVFVKDVSNRVKCHSCGRVIALGNTSVMLVKGSILVDADSASVVAKCHRCKTINHIKMPKK